ncbi:hypothetical protein GGF46_003102 [Coemansia sp. RSA 552]|nr:hypothetical protein GGF46_003102 [Coemansia sp. RSA 552]
MGCSVQQLPGLESITGARGRCACQQASGGFQLQHPNTFPRANAEAKTPEDADSAPGSADSKQRAAGAGSPCAGMEGAAARIPGKRRKRHHDIASKVRSVQPVPRDRDGNYEMPVQVGVLMVLRLGRVVWDRDVFHNERYIWPVGYTVQREYYSMVDPDREVIYTCWVSEGKDAPLFHIEAEDMPDSPVTAPTATGAWTTVLRRVNQIRHRVHSNSASGPDYFGFSHPTIAKMIQDLAGSDKCRAYVRQHFVEMKERHVRGVLKKGRGGRPPAELFSRGQRALKASSGKLAQQQDQARRISVATLTEGHTEGPR